MKAKNLPTTNDQLKRDLLLHINLGIKDIEEGKIHSHESVIHEFEDKLFGLNISEEEKEIVQKRIENAKPEDFKKWEEEKDKFKI